jgi:hypothetical protein
MPLTKPEVELSPRRVSAGLRSLRRSQLRSGHQEEQHNAHDSVIRAGR